MSKKEGSNTVFRSRDMVYVAVMAAVLAVLAQFSIPMPTGTLLTLQTFAVALCGSVLGIKKGLAAVGVYLLLGAVGLPV
ncbi:MAG: biotin transporter BioY, partial [Firmicutes bacterium]|nr:biotin transporter BioY [Bacillota bacterium]